jgi:glycerol-3-phosphate O-acyltransferase
VTHSAIRSPLDYYAFGCDFFRPAVDLPRSVVSGSPSLSLAAAQMRRGENVVFLANHQSEADPQVMSLMLEKEGHAELAQEL